MPKKSKAAKPEALICAHVVIVGHAVFRDGQACKLVNVSGSHKGGVLLPGVPLITFLKVRDAERAIERTERVRHSMRTSLVSEWIRSQVPSFLEGSKFTVEPVGRQV